jgi:hypothetical protein
MATHRTENIPVSSINAACKETTVTDADLKLLCPFRLMITGPTDSGKSSFLLNIVRHRQVMCSESFGRIVYCIPESDTTIHVNNFVEALREEFEDLELVKGLPDVGMCNSGNHLLVSSVVGGLKTMWFIYPVVISGHPRRPGH